MENLKIKNYEKGVSSLPDYPSDKGYTAEMLKAVFDSRSDKEIKEKHNALCDATAEISEELKIRGQQIEETSDELAKHASSQTAHEALFGAVREEIAGANSGLEEHASSEQAHEALFGVIREELAKKTEGESATNLQNGEGEVSLKQTAWKDEAANSATGKGAVALGGYNKADAKCSMAVNYNNEVNAPNAFAANSANKIPESCTSAFVAGHCNEAKYEYQAIFGTYSNVEAPDAFVVGNGSAEIGRKNAFKVTKSGDAVVEGNITSQNVSASNNIKAEKDISCKTFTASEKASIGTANIAEHHISYGKNTVSGRGSAAVGGNNEVKGDTSFACITSNTVPENFTHVFIAGHANTATGSHQAIFGTYADPQTSDCFVVGNGNSAERSNAFAVDKSGNITIGGTKFTLGETVFKEENIVQFTDYATPDKAGVVKVNPWLGGSGLTMRQDGNLMIFEALEADIDVRQSMAVITAAKLDYAVSAATNKEWKDGTYTEEQRALPISAGVFEEQVLQLKSRIEQLEKLVAGEGTTESESE